MSDKISPGNDAQPGKNHPVEGVSFPDIMSGEIPEQHGLDSREIGLRKLQILFQSNKVEQEDRGEMNVLKSSGQRDSEEEGKAILSFSNIMSKKTDDNPRTFPEAPANPPGTKNASIDWDKEPEKHKLWRDYGKLDHVLEALREEQLSPEQRKRLEKIKDEILTESVNTIPSTVDMAYQVRDKWLAQGS